MFQGFFLFPAYEGNIETRLTRLVRRCYVVVRPSAKGEFCMRIAICDNDMDFVLRLKVAIDYC